MNGIATQSLEGEEEREPATKLSLRSKIIWSNLPKPETELRQLG